MSSTRSAQPYGGLELVVDLADLQSGAHTLTLAGGKALNLGRLIRAGLPVPTGVCVTTAAYRLAVAPLAELETLLETMAAASASDTVKLSGLASEARARILDSPVPQPVARAITAGYEALSNASVAVRSSATAEDLPFASFAGQQETYLNVVGVDAVLDAVRRCWASLWTDRAVVYRATNGIDPRGVHLAVVIQRMVQSAVAGVLFTADPVTGRRRRAVIDASPGLGEAVVSGSVNPDHFVVETASGEVLERRLGDKRVVVRSRADGGTERAEGTLTPEASCLDEEAIRELAFLGDRVEALYGAPQDIEWAVDAGGKIWLTQARPITTLFPLPDAAPPPDEPRRVYFSFSVAQGVFRPFTPMGLAALRALASSGSGILGFPVARPLDGPAIYAEAAQRVFGDVTAVMKSRLGRAIAPRVLDIMEARSAVILRSLFSEPDLRPNRLSPLPLVRTAFRLATRLAFPVTATRALLSPSAAQRHAQRVGAVLRARLALQEPASPLERLDHAERILLRECMPMAPRVMPAAVVGLGMWLIARKLLGRDAEVAELENVLRALPDNVTTEMDLSLWSLARRIMNDERSASVFRESTTEDLAARFREKRLPQTAQEGLAGFLERYGHRAVAEIDLGMPRWSDDPRHLLGVLANYLRGSDEGAAAGAQFSERADEAEATILALTQRASHRSFLRGWIVHLALRRARALIGLRELPKFYIVLGIAAARRQLTLIGEELARRGSILEPDDVFFLDLVEVRAGLEDRGLKDPIAERRAVYEREIGRRHLPRVLLSDGTEPQPPATATTTATATAEGGLSGTPASSGRVRGRARVILDPIGAHLEPGEILVAPSTDPGWTPLFLTAGGLVMEMGGANSHGAVVAREYGIPAVVGVPNATSHIVSGETVEVDGTAGTVTKSSRG